LHEVRTVFSADRVDGSPIQFESIKPIKRLPPGMCHGDNDDFFRSTKENKGVRKRMKQRPTNFTRASVVFQHGELKRRGGDTPQSGFKLIQKSVGQGGTLPVVPSSGFRSLKFGD